MNNGTKKYFSTEYSILVCLLLLKIWCGFANQAFLFLAGGLVSAIIDLGLCMYIVLNARRANNTGARSRATSDFIIALTVFSLIYSLIFMLGADTLPKISVYGFFDLPKQIYNTVFSVIYFCPLALIVKTLSEGERKIVANFLLAMFFVVALANLITVITNPELAKNEAYNEGTSLFTLGYSGSYTLALITPIILYKLGSTKHKVIFAMILACNLASVFYGGYFIAILGTIVALLVYWVLSMKNRLAVILLGLVIVVSLLVLLFSGALEDAMWYLSENISIDVLSGRCADIAEYLSGNTDVDTGDTTFRIYIYQDTFRNFLKHPILGNYIFGDYACQWDHSTILDILAVGGLLLGGLFFAFIAYGYKFACAFIRDERAKRALLAAIVAYLFIATINSVLSYRTLGILFVVAPIIMGGGEEK